MTSLFINNKNENYQKKMLTLVKIGSIIVSPHLRRNMISLQELSQIRKIDLLTYLQNYEPSELVKDKSGTYHTVSHDSLKISNGKWFWWSRGIGGRSALDYLINVRGMSFTEAVKTIAEKASILAPVTVKQNPKKYEKVYLPRYTFLCSNVRRYLLSRGIDNKIITEFIKKKMIAEDVKTKNALFFGYDDNGKIRQCSVRSTCGETVKKEVAGSDKTYCFRSLSDTSKSTVRVFESAIDLLSFATLMKQNGRDYRTENLISLSGIYKPSGKNTAIKIPSPLQKYLDERPETNKIYLHFDSDDAGKTAAESIIAALENDYEVRFIPPPEGKDFNDYLMKKERDKAQWKKENIR